MLMPLFCQAINLFDATETLTANQFCPATGWGRTWRERMDSFFAQEHKKLSPAPVVRRRSPGNPSSGHGLASARLSSSACQYSLALVGVRQQLHN